MTMDTRPTGSCLDIMGLGLGFRVYGVRCFLVRDLSGLASLEGREAQHRREVEGERRRS